MTENVLCTQCDAANPRGAAFCTACGAALRPAATGPTRRLAAPAVGAPRRCRACGGANPAEALYCVGCGARLGHEAQPVARHVGMAPAIVAVGPAQVQTVYVPVASELPLLVRALWFFCIGLPLGLAWVMVAWAFILTLIGLPVGLWMLTLMPQVMTLRQGRPTPTRSVPQQAVSMAVRVVYFVLIGWWLSLVWMLLAWGAAATVIGLPLAFLMFERTGAVLTLSET